MEKVIVTGVNGFMGNHLVNELLDQGYGVIGVGREEQLNPDLVDRVDSYYYCDLVDYDQVKDLPLTQAKAIINLAGLAATGPSFDNPELYMRVNTAVVDTVCKAAIEQEAKSLRILSISSGAVYQSGQPLPLNEESKLNPDSSPYAASKIAMEDLSLKYREEGLDSVVARPFNHIGPGQLPGFILPDLYQKTIDAVGSGQKELAVGNITTKRDYTDVRDVAKAYVKLATQDTLNHGIYNVCTGRSLSGEEILDTLFEVMGVGDIKPVVDESLFRPSDDPNIYGDNSRLKQDTGWEVTIDIEQTIRDFVESQKPVADAA